MNAGQWRADALCRTEGEPEEWFPNERPGPLRRERISTAVQVCRRCPVAEPCLTFAIEAGAIYGIYGGKTEKERAAMRRSA